MKVDKKATAAARKRHEEGVTRLRKAFGWTPAAAANLTPQYGRKRKKAA